MVPRHHPESLYPLHIPLKGDTACRRWDRKSQLGLLLSQRTVDPSTKVEIGQSLGLRSLSRWKDPLGYMRSTEMDAHNHHRCYWSQRLRDHGTGVLTRQRRGPLHSLTASPCRCFHVDCHLRVESWKLRHMDSNRPRRRRDRFESLLTEPTLAADSEYHRRGSTSCGSFCGWQNEV